MSVQKGMILRRLASAVAMLSFLIASVNSATAGIPAEVVITGASISTAQAQPAEAQALAISTGRIVFVGSVADAQAWTGPATKVVQLSGQRVLPGLVDAHVHALDILDLDVCDLKSKAVSLAELAVFVKACIARYKVSPGELLRVHAWNYVAGNQPTAQFPTLRAALDAASTDVRIELLGSDEHHGAFNSVGLASARAEDGTVVGLSTETLRDRFAIYRKSVGVDAKGELNGAVNEDARLLIDEHAMLNNEIAQVAKAPERVPRALNRAGITAFMDAMVTKDALPVYAALSRSDQMTARATLALFYDPEKIRKGGRADFDSMVAQAKATRASFAGNERVRADFVKLFADGVLEGNPYADPPMLPNAGSIKPFLQPLFGVDSAGVATVKGYVDPGSALCKETRANLSNLDPAAVQSFHQRHGFYPVQCDSSFGQLQHDRATILEFARVFHLAGFNLHIHAIGDLAVRAAVDAIEAARKADGNSATHDSLAHLQLVAPEDAARIGRDHLYLALTYAWMNVAQSYDVTVIPFFERVSGNSYDALHPPDSYYERNVYPARSLLQAGAILVAGSDAPVETIDPRPFFNMARAMDRRLPGEHALGRDQTLDFATVLAAYTINGARMLGIDSQAGSLAIGKSADFIVLDRDVVALAGAGRTDDIAATKVLQTWFRGERVFTR